MTLDCEFVDLGTARQRLATARVGHLATVTADVRPHVVPCCFVLQDLTVYSAIDAKPKSTLDVRRLHNLKTNPSFSLLVDHYDEDWTTLWWIRIDGFARMIEGGDERQRALSLLAAKYDQYRDAPPPGLVLALDIGHWRTWP
jgi:PPOX class probable F420-dependent enzyme